jgi:hypothetical protein
MENCWPNAAISWIAGMVLLGLDAGGGDPVTGSGLIPSPDLRLLLAERTPGPGKRAANRSRKAYSYDDRQPEGAGAA